MSLVARGGQSRLWSADLVTHRALIDAVSGLFILPNVVFAGWLQPVPAGLLLAGCLVGFALIHRTPAADADGWLERPVSLGRLQMLIAVSAVIFLLGGEGHFFYPNPDWLIRDAVLADLVRGSTIPTYSLTGSDYLLRAPVGMYMLPALVGRLVGLSGAHFALLGQNSLLLGAILYILTSGTRGPARLWILLLFAGICVLPRLTFGFDGLNTLRTARPLDEWAPGLQFSSTITQFFWVPNHALPGWWIATLALLCRRDRALLPVLLVATGSLVIWSPLAVLPSVPFASWLLIQAGWRTLGTGRIWVGAAAAACFAPAAIYLVLGSGEIAHAVQDGSPDFLILLGLFLVVQLPSAAFVLARRKHLPDELRGLFGVSLAILVVLPFVSFGPANDLVMRSSIPALVIVALSFAEVLLRLPPEQVDWRRTGIVLVAVGSLSAVVEITRAVRTPTFAISDCTLLEASAGVGETGVPTNYIVPLSRVPDWLIVPPTTGLVSVPARQCWPGLKRPDLP